ncbi:hypothetical protein LINGRAHAP2_LOCUS10231 [Linum grandiflorum]
MRRSIFLRIVEGVMNHDSYFQSTTDATGQKFFAALQKCTSAIQMLACGTATGTVDEYLRIGTLNDINVLDRSPVFHEVLEGKAPQVQFTVNENIYNMGYYLTDGIYPNWATFIKSISLPQGPKHKLFAKMQEAARKDVERAFGVLQARFAIINGPSDMWCKDIIGDIMRACIIMHNMIVEDEWDSYLHNFDYTNDQVNFNVSIQWFLELVSLSMKSISEIMQGSVVGQQIIDFNLI